MFQKKKGQNTVATNGHGGAIIPLRGGYSSSHRFICRNRHPHKLDLV